MIYGDKVQAQIEAQLLHTLSGSHPEMAMVDSEQITGATMLWHNIPYDEARARVEQALSTLTT